eukprot:1724275-Rhodomonas_salina.2
MFLENGFSTSGHAPQLRLAFLCLFISLLAPLSFLCIIYPLSTILFSPLSLSLSLVTSLLLSALSLPVCLFPTVPHSPLPLPTPTAHSHSPLPTPILEARVLRSVRWKSDCMLSVGAGLSQFHGVKGPSSSMGRNSSVADEVENKERREDEKMERGRRQSAEKGTEREQRQKEKRRRAK